MDQRVESSIAHIDLFEKPTPLQHLTRLSRSLSKTPAVDIWIKRDDLMSVGLGGSKLRNLELLVADAQAAGADTLVAGGGPFNNHCRLTAAAGARAGMDVVVIFSGARPVVLGANERICELYGAELRYDVDLLDDRARLAGVVDDMSAEGRRPYLIPAGASGPIGAGGPLLAGLEVARQLEQVQISPDYLFVGVSTGGTYAGLMTGLWLAGLDTEVIGVPTHLGDSASEPELRAHIAALSAELRQLWRPGSGQVTNQARDEALLDDLTDWIPFGATASAAVAAAKRLGTTEAIAVDPTYTARALSGMLAWADAGRLDGKTVVLWDGGGITALFEPSLAR
jgi:L-cysteate sulfo-lyase